MMQIFIYICVVYIVVQTTLGGNGNLEHAHLVVAITTWVLNLGEILCDHI